MRKQTKLVAVLSASALLALGASMTSYAAGWTEENGTWVYYDNDGYQVTDEWRRSGNYWFWLNDDGEMATNQLVEDDDDYYYVDSNGAMVTNRWIQLENEDMDDDDDSEYVWYYFQNNGKAYKAGTNSTSFKTINGKKYAFDDEGQMLWGWVNEDSSRETGDDAWMNATYYCGTPDDGAMVTGWAKIHVVDENAEERNGSDYDDEDQDYWFYFKSNGKKVVAENGDAYETKTINGNKYAFDEQGVMQFEWNDGFVSTDSDISSDSTATAADWQYYNNREAGNRAKGWFKVVPSEGLNADDYDDGSSHWYYSKNDGTLYAHVIKSINGKKYAFNNEGEMLDGLWALKVGDDNTISDYFELDSEDDLKTVCQAGYDGTSEDEYADWDVYYFGDGDDGAMKLSNQNVEVDGDVYSFFFMKDGANKGKGFGSNATKESYRWSELSENAPVEDSYVYDDKAVYVHGLKVEADSDLRYEAVNIKTGEKVARRDVEKELAKDARLILVNTSGSIMKNKSAVKDGDEYYYKTNKYGYILGVDADKDVVRDIPDEGESVENN